MTDANGHVETFEQLVGLKERRFTDVEVRGKKFRMRTLTARELRRIRNSLYDDKGDAITDRVAKIPYLLLCHCLVNSQDKPFLSETQLEDLDEVDGGILESLGAAALDFTGWRVQYDIAAIEEIAGN